MIKRFAHAIMRAPLQTKGVKAPAMPRSKRASNRHREVGNREGRTDDRTMLRREYELSGRAECIRALLNNRTSAKMCQATRSRVIAAFPYSLTCCAGRAIARRVKGYSVKFLVLFRVRTHFATKLEILLHQVSDHDHLKADCKIQSQRSAVGVRC